MTNNDKSAAELISDAQIDAFFPSNPFGGTSLAHFNAAQVRQVVRSVLDGYVQDLIDWAAERWHAEVKNRPMVNIHRRSLDDTWRQVLRHLGVDDRARLGPTHDELRAEIGSKEWERMNGAAPGAAIDAREQEVKREFTNELGNAIRITIEGPTSVSENVLTRMETEQLRGALNDHAEPEVSPVATEELNWFDPMRGGFVKRTGDDFSNVKPPMCRIAGVNPDVLRRAAMRLRDEPPAVDAGEKGNSVASMLKDTRPLHEQIAEVRRRERPTAETLNMMVGASRKEAPAASAQFYEEQPDGTVTPVDPTDASFPATVAQPVGWQLVPVEPTPAMLHAMWQDRESFRGQSENKTARHHYALMLKAAPAQPCPSQGCEEPPSAKQQKLLDLADRIDHEELWRWAGMDHHKMRPEQRDRMNAGVALRRYAHLWAPGRWVVFPPVGPVHFSASTLDKAVEMAKRDQSRRNASEGDAR